MTQRQFTVLSLIGEGNPDGSPIDLDQVLDQLFKAYGLDVTKAATQFTIRVLIEKDLIAKAGLECRGGRSRVLYALTDVGRAVLGP